MSTFLSVAERDGIVTVIMNAPEARNALTGNTAIAEFIDLCSTLTDDPAAKVMILSGQGSVFSSGGNIKEMRKNIAPDVTPGNIRDVYRKGIQRLALAVYNLEIPTIAAINGPALGAGCDLACMCDIRIASENATFAESFINLGLIAGDGGAWLLPRAVGYSRAAEMTFTGDSISAADARDCGLVSRVVPSDKLMLEARKLADRIARHPGAALRMSKQLMREGAHMRLETLLDMSASMQALVTKSMEHEVAVSAFLERKDR